MWLNHGLITDNALSAYRETLLGAVPNFVVIDRLFDEAKLDQVTRILRQPQYWQTQKHTYSALYVDNAQWQQTTGDQRFVHRDVWRRESDGANKSNANPAQDFLLFLRSNEFRSLLSRIFNSPLSDDNLAEPENNTNYFRLRGADFVKQHVDESPGRKVCMLLYLNRDWDNSAGGELTFIGTADNSISIAPLYNRCVFFDPASKGSEHWVESLNFDRTDEYRYNVTSWYWSE